MNRKDETVFAAWVGMIRSCQSLTTRVEESLKRADLPPLSWYDVLLEINREKDKRLRLQEIGERVLLAKNNVTRLVDRLEKDALVTRKKCADDGRGVFAYITPKGSALIDTMWSVYREAVRDLFASRLTTAELAQLISIQAKLIAK